MERRGIEIGQLIPYHLSYHYFDNYPHSLPFSILITHGVDQFTYFLIFFRPQSTLSPCAFPSPLPPFVETIVTLHLLGSILHCMLSITDIIVVHPILPTSEFIQAILFFSFSYMHFTFGPDLGEKRTPFLWATIGFNSHPTYLASSWNHWVRSSNNLLSHVLSAEVVSAFPRLILWLSLRLAFLFFSFSRIPTLMLFQL